MSEFVYTTALRKIRKMSKRIKIIPGGSSSGKTFSIIPILIDRCIKRKNLRVSIVSESVPHLRRGVIRDFISIMRMTNRYNDRQWNRTNFIYTFTNGSYIEFFAADSADKLRGSRRDVLFINECNNVTLESYTQLSMRTNEDIYLDYNPSHRFWADDLKDSKDSETLVLTYKDNECLPQNIIDFLEERREWGKTSEYWKNWFNVYGLGLTGKLEGVVFQDYKIINSIPEEAKLLGYGLDFGFSQDPSTLISLYKLDNQLIVDEIFYSKGLSNKDIVNLIKQENITSPIYADSSEPKSIKEIRDYSIRILPATKGKDSINFGIQLLQNYEILVTNRSTNLINELNNYSWKKETDGSTSNIPIDAFNHTIDALRYVAVMTIRVNKPLAYRVG